MHARHGLGPPARVLNRKNYGDCMESEDYPRESPRSAQRDDRREGGAAHPCGGVPAGGVSPVVRGDLNSDRSAAAEDGNKLNDPEVGVMAQQRAGRGRSVPRARIPAMGAVEGTCGEDCSRLRAKLFPKSS